MEMSKRHAPIYSHAKTPSQLSLLLPKPHLRSQPYIFCLLTVNTTSDSGYHNWLGMKFSDLLLPERAYPAQGYFLLFYLRTLSELYVQKWVSKFMQIIRWWLLKDCRLIFLFRWLKAELVGWESCFSLTCWCLYPLKGH